MAKRVLITGGAGFIGRNLVEHNMELGNSVTVFDNLSRPGGGSKLNADYLENKYRGNSRFNIKIGDVRHYQQVTEAMRDIDVVYHLAAQTAVTTSMENPLEDFEVNGIGSFNMLDVAKGIVPSPIVVYTSTNKVYGDLSKKPVMMKDNDKRWDFIEDEYRDGISEDYPLDYESPYGCSKGIGDAYCLDYARTFGLKTVVFRMSAIYGIGQNPLEGQGWIAWLVRRAIDRQPITIYGDGKQVRDALFVSDLVRAFDGAVDNIERTKGQAYNIGGGRANSLSILELLKLMEDDLGINPSQVNYADWRRADQKVYISNTLKANRDFGWSPEISVSDGIRKLHSWMSGNEGRLS